MRDTLDTPTSVGFPTQLEEVFRSIVDHAGAKTVFGEPVSVPGRTIVPVAKIRYGFGGGSGGRAENQRGGGGGGGFVGRPLGFVEVTQSHARFVPIFSPWTIFAAIGIGLCLGFLAVPRRP